MPKQRSVPTIDSSCQLSIGIDVNVHSLNYRIKAPKPAHVASIERMWIHTTNNIIDNHQKMVAGKHSFHRMLLMLGPSRWSQARDLKRPGHNCSPFQHCYPHYAHYGDSRGSCG